MLRDYQQEVYDKGKMALLKNKHVIYQMPCRSGKSYLMLQICEDAAKKGSKVLILAHRNLLLEQLGALIKKGNVKIRSVQTETKNISDEWYPDIILVDECHLSATDSYTRIFSHYNKSILIGFTATPCRLDGKPLGNIYQEIIKGPSVKYLIEKGCISPFDHYAPKLDIDMSKVKVGDGDYMIDELEAAMIDPKIYGDIISNYEKLAKDKQAVAYCVTIRHADEICKLFNDNGYEAKCIHSKMTMKARRQILQDFKDKKFKILCSVNTISEGITLPSCEVCLMLRPTQSYALYMQQGMRALTPQPNKRAIIIDYVGNVFRHGSIDEDNEWSLTERKKCRNPSGVPEVLVRTCKHCMRAYSGNDPICPYCGFDNGKTRREIEQEKKIELEKIEAFQKKKRRQEVGMQNTFKGLVAIARERGYKAGWLIAQSKVKHIPVDWAEYNRFKREEM